LLSADGTRALIATQVYDYGARLTDPHSTRVAVIDTTTGRQIGTTLTLPGKLYGAQRLSADGTHILITTSPWNTLTNTGSTKMAVIDTTTGAPAGSTLTIKGETAVEPLFSADGTRALIATTVFSRTAVATRVGVLRIT
jgi:protein subunit release factor B